MNLKAKTIVIDDLHTMRKIVSKMLKEIGFSNIQEADDGESGWSIIEAAHDGGEPFDFVISDLNMPKMSGLELLQKIRSDERFKKLPFLMITSEAEQSVVIKIVKEGISNYIVKPYTQETMKEKISKIL